MRTRNSNFPNNSNVTNPRLRNRGRAPNIVEPELRNIVEVVPMADNLVPADSSSSIPADYVSAGHVLVSADRDRIC
ncbi:hypothetical protein Tco_0593941 [Tanacetum coccineum]